MTNLTLRFNRAGMKAIKMNDVSVTSLEQEWPSRARVGLQARVRWLLLLGAWGLWVYPLVPSFSYANNVYGFANRISFVSFNCQFDEFYHRWNGVFEISQNSFMSFKRIFNYTEQTKLRTESAFSEITGSVTIFKYNYIISNIFGSLIDSDTSDQSIGLNTKNSKLQNAAVTIGSLKFLGIGYTDLFSNIGKRIHYMFLNFLCSNENIVFFPKKVFGNFINIIVQNFTFDRSGSNNKESSEFLYFACGIWGNNFNSIAISDGFSSSAIGSNDNLSICSSYEDQSLPADTIPASDKNEKRQPKYLRFHAPIILDICEEDTGGFCYEPTETAEMFVSDDSINWFQLFPKQYNSQWGERYGIRSFFYISETTLLKRSSFESSGYHDYDYIIDLSIVDCDISFDGFKWFHIFDTDCVDGHLPYYESNANITGAGAAKPQDNAGSTTEQK